MSPNDAPSGVGPVVNLPTEEEIKKTGDAAEPRNADLAQMREQLEQGEIDLDSYLKRVAAMPIDLGEPVSAEPQLPATAMEWPPEPAATTPAAGPLLAESVVIEPAVASDESLAMDAPALVDSPELPTAITPVGVAGNPESSPAAIDLVQYTESSEPPPPATATESPPERAATSSPTESVVPVNGAGEPIVEAGSATESAPEDKEPWATEVEAPVINEPELSAMVAPVPPPIEPETPPGVITPRYPRSPIPHSRRGSFSSTRAPPVARTARDGRFPVGTIFLYLAVVAATSWFFARQSRPPMPSFEPAPVVRNTESRSASPSSPSPAIEVAPAVTRPVIGFASQARIVISESTRFIKIPVRATGPLRKPVQLSVVTINGAAEVNRDFVPPVATLTLTPAQPSAEVLVSLLSDEQPEYVEDFSVVLRSAGGPAKLARRSVMVVLLDDDERLSSNRN